VNSRDFCYWLQGFFEIGQSYSPQKQLSLDSVQTDMIRKHLALVFKHEIDPSFGPPEKQAELDKIHHGPFQNNDGRVRC
jgi:hypothetical protein